ncbi:MFS general substrate transporter [Aspergillus steynii IBT 23096]|uniref:MFS general substrate transporter n=1 Tax=Aspergillus steynii IBT 23096 TaxID=1392250 RepID=A0A2I2G0U0_9EURO|nr:MFS general substrate transporter [Aspergillus steynii IBT 23096]PLB46489.1 MFS general substrate transporter [Aspergillus steynii IBT 23096]
MQKDRNSASHVENAVELNDDPKKATYDTSRIDGEIQQYLSELPRAIDEETDRTLKRKIDYRVLTIMMGTYFLQALDKGTLGSTSIMGLPQDAGLAGQQYSWLSTCIYIAVFMVEYPTNWLIQRLPAAKYLGINVVLWGIVLALHAVGKNFISLVALRTLLGIFEACCQPLLLLMSSMWYKRSEQGSIIVYWYMMTGVQSIVGGLLAYAFSLIGNTGVLRSYEALFVTYGAVSVLWGVIIITWMPDSPMPAKCFTEEEKILMIERVRANQTGLQNKKFRVYQVWEAFRDPQVYCYILLQICTTLPTNGLSTFVNIVINSFDFSVLHTQLLAMVFGVYITLVLLLSAWLVRKFDQTLLVMAGFVLPSFAGTAVLMTVQNNTPQNRIGLLISYYIAMSFFAAQTLSLSLVSRNVAGQTKKAVVVAANFCAWAVGNAVGPQVFFSWDAPRYRVAFSVHLGCYSMLMCILIFLRVWFVTQNRRRDRAQGATEEDLSAAFEDRTDMENEGFRYMY